jgi:hypothetical protein
MGFDKGKILLTGSHRSGTTWVAKMIAAAPSIGYIHEPFNPVIHRPWLCSHKFEGFTYITRENETPFVRPLGNTFDFSFNWWGALKSLRSRGDLKRRFNDFRQCRDHRKQSLRPLIKDPIAVFSAQWLAATFDMDVIVLIRHPAAFVSSILRVGWRHDFANLLAQPLLMRDYLQPFEAEIRDFAEKDRSLLDQAILIWRLIHHVIDMYRDKHEDWIFLRHEDISSDPLTQFERIFECLRIPFSQAVREIVEAHSSPSNPLEAPDNAINFIKRNSKSNVLAWKQRLSPEEIDCIKQQTRDIYPAFYSETDW